MEQRLKENLSQDLPMLKPADLMDIVCVMSGKKINRTVDALTASLVTSRVEIGVLLSALLRYQWMIVQELMTSIRPENLNAQLHAFSVCIERFSILQSSIVTAFDQSWHAALAKEVSARVLSECNAHWLSSGYVYLHNYFNEMPVVAKAKYNSFDGVQLSVQMTPEVGRVFACTNDMNEAAITSQNRGHKITVGVINCRKDVLILAVRHVKVAMQECRENVRIRLPDPVSMKIKRHDGVINGKLIDISASGLRLEVAGDAVIRTGEQMACAWMLGENKIIAEVIVCWTHADTGIRQAGLKFKALGSYNEQVRKFMFAQQQQLVARLKKLGTPVWVK